MFVCDTLTEPPQLYSDYSIPFILYGNYILDPLWALKRKTIKNLIRRNWEKLRKLPR